MDLPPIVATKEMCAYCFDAILHYIDHQETLLTPRHFPTANSPLFVTWHINGTELRGCIGITLS